MSQKEAHIFCKYIVIINNIKKEKFTVTHIKNIVFFASYFCFVMCFGFLAGLQSNWTAEGAVGSAEGHGGHASVSA